MVVIVLRRCCYGVWVLWRHKDRGARLTGTECLLGHSPSRHCLNWGISVLMWTFNFPLFPQQCQLPVLQCLLNMGKINLTII